jgi:cytochrome c-type biogenesis protein CcmE
VDVTPRTAPVEPAPPKPPRSRRGLAIGLVLVGLVGVTGFLLVKVVGDASLYYYNADEAVAKKAELGDRTFRIQGTYVDKAAETDGGTIAFTIAFNGARVAVEHSGSEPALFKPGNAVVLEGRWSPDGSTFLSDRIEVKHGEEYREENPDRVPADAP